MADDDNDECQDGTGFLQRSTNQKKNKNFQFFLVIFLKV